MRHDRPLSPNDPYRYEPASPQGYAPVPYSAIDPGQPPGPYALADDEAEYVNAPWRAAGGKRVRTTLGRPWPGPRPIVSVDPNARMASALRPATMPAAQVRVINEPEFEAQAHAQRATAMLYLRPLVAREPRGRRWLFTGIALLVSAAFCFAILHFWAPASASPDAQAPLLAGRLLAENHSLRLVPHDPFSFVGGRWVAGERVAIAGDGAAVQEYFPKDPAGLPLLYAAFFWLAPGDDQAVRWAHLASPVAATLAVLASFFLCRFAGGSFLGLLGMLAMAASQVLLQATNDPAGHSVSLALVAWGFCFMLWWWRSGNALLGLLAGLLLGLAFTVRYADGLLAVPLIFACVFAWHWRRPLTSGLMALVPIFGWALPVAALLYWNRREMGAWTAYHLAGELGWFDLDNIAHNWQTLLLQLDGAGLYFLLPLGALGLLALVARRLPLGLMMLAWFLLPILAYGAYAWSAPAPQRLPYVLSILPVVLLGVTYLLRRLLWAPSDSAPQLLVAQDPYTGQTVHMLAEPTTPLWRSLASPIAAGLVIAAAVGLGASRSVAGDDRIEGTLAHEHLRAVNLAAMGQFARQKLADGDVLFVDVPIDGGSAANHLDIYREFELYDAAMFTARFARRISAPWSPVADEGDPAPLSRRRHEYLQHLYEGAGEAELGAAVRRIADRALDEQRGVWLLMSAADARRFEQAHFPRGYEAQTAAVFSEWAGPGDADSTDALANRPVQWTLVKIAREAELAPPATVVLAR